MRFSTRETAVMTLGVTCMCLLGCPGVLPDGPTDSTTPAPCTADADCPEEIACVFADGMDQDGFCNVEETQTP